MFSRKLSCIIFTDRRQTAAFQTAPHGGNDTASERRMYRRYMIDCICYWVKEYHVDGFRFDLMGLHDTETMNEIRAALDCLPGGKEILMYGEPWTAGKDCDSARL